MFSLPFVDNELETKMVIEQISEIKATSSTRKFVSSSIGRPVSLAIFVQKVVCRFTCRFIEPWSMRTCKYLRTLRERF